MNPESFFHVAVKIDDVDESLSFYRDYFDAEVLERSEAADGDAATAVSYVALEVADKRVYLFDRAPYEAVGLVGNLPTGFLHYGFVVDDVASAYRDLSADGVDFIMEPETFDDLKIAFCTDPSGVRIELLEHLD